MFTKAEVVEINDKEDEGERVVDKTSDPVVDVDSGKCVKNKGFKLISGNEKVDEVTMTGAGVVGVVVVVVFAVVTW